MSEGSLDRRADGMDMRTWMRMWTWGGGGGDGLKCEDRDRSDKLMDQDRTAAGGEMDAAGLHMEGGANAGL